MLLKLKNSSGLSGLASLLEPLKEGKGTKSDLVNRSKDSYRKWKGARKEQFWVRWSVGMVRRNSQWGSGCERVVRRIDKNMYVGSSFRHICVILWQMHSFAVKYQGVWSACGSQEQGERRRLCSVLVAAAPGCAVEVSKGTSEPGSGGAAGAGGVSARPDENLMLG